MANPKKETVSVDLDIETGHFILPPGFQDDALAIFNARYADREPENPRISFMQHVVGRQVHFVIEAKMLPVSVPGATDVAGDKAK